MSAEDRLTPKEIKAWGYKTLDAYYLIRLDGITRLKDEEIVELMYKAYKRGYQDALSG